MTFDASGGVMVRGGRECTAIGAVIVVLGLATAGSARSSPPSAHGFEETPAAKAMASVFSRPSSGRVPASIAAAITRLAKTAPVGRVLVNKGRLLLAGLGPRHRAIYVFPTTRGEVCFDVTGLGAGCKKAFLVGEPISMDGANLHWPPTSGPPAELAGLTKDAVTKVQVVLNGVRRDAVFKRDAWYYRFPNNRIRPTAATKLVVTLRDGATKTVPTGIVKPKFP